MIAHDHTDPALSVAAITAAVGMHPGAMSRLIQRSTRRSTLAYLQEVRLAHAERLLSDPGCKVASAAHGSGFGSVSRLRLHFSSRHEGPARRKRHEAHRG